MELFGPFKILFLFPRSPQHKPRPSSSLCSTPSKKKPISSSSTTGTTASTTTSTTGTTGAPCCNYNEQLRLAMELSAREQEEAELQRQREEAELQRIIRLSLMEK